MVEELIPILRDTIHRHLGDVAKREGERLLDEYKEVLQKQFAEVLTGMTLELFRQMSVSYPMGNKIVIELKLDNLREKK